MVSKETEEFQKRALELRKKIAKLVKEIADGNKQ